MCRGNGLVVDAVSVVVAVVVDGDAGDDDDDDGIRSRRALLWPKQFFAYPSKAYHGCGGQGAGGC